MECLNRRHCSALKMRGMTCEGRIVYCLEWRITLTDHPGFLGLVTVSFYTTHVCKNKYVYMNIFDKQRKVQLDSIVKTLIILIKQICIACDRFGMWELANPSS